MADISTGRQRGIVPFVDETTGRLPDQYLPQGVIDLQGDLEQAVSSASQSATAAKASAESATQSASAAAQSAESASGDAIAAKASADGAASSASAAKASETAAASSATAAAESEAAAKASETAAARSAQTATEQVSSIGDSVERAAASATAAQQSATESSTSAQAAKASETNAASSASAAKTSETNAADSATAAQQAVDGFGLEVGTTTTGDPGTDAAVSIVKQGTKYVADFTIPRGADGQGGSGGIQSVSVSAPLTGDGSFDNPIGIGVIPIEKGGTGASEVKGAGIKLFKGNVDPSGTNINDSSKLLIYQSGAVEPQSVFAYKLGSSVWGYIQSKIETVYPDITQLVNLVTKVQALESARNPVELDEGADINSIINKSGTYIKPYGKTAVNGPAENYNKAGSKYVITVLNNYGDAYQKIEPIVGVSDIYYRMKDSVGIGPWYKVSATRQ